MPPPYAIYAYRGYTFVEWNKDGQIEVITQSAEYIDTVDTVEDAERLIDERMNAK